jgi:hypothetical protein
MMMTLFFAAAEVVERFERKAIHDRGIADNIDNIVIFFFEDRGRWQNLPPPKGKFRYGRLRSNRRQIRSAVRNRSRHWLAQMLQRTAAQNLMGIALVADIEDEFVFREVEIPVEGNRQFDDAEVRSKWPP